MPRKFPSATRADSVVLPLDAYLELQKFHDELVGIADTIDPGTPPTPSIQRLEQSRRRALARVFRLWAKQIERSLIAT
ncbi:XAC0095 family protein [Lysobacter enzymogenes]|uniref:XAC0095 family protein n=1 Tax=Lysobacter enzymogenes TaxID=69 RepID=UPI0019D135B8|nr:hypothetical protein [Lysobacter enzymogenes]